MEGDENHLVLKLKHLAKNFIANPWDLEKHLDGINELIKEIKKLQEENVQLRKENNELVKFHQDSKKESLNRHLELANYQQLLTEYTEITNGFNRLSSEKMKNEMEAKNTVEQLKQKNKKLEHTVKVQDKNKQNLEREIKDLQSKIYDLKKELCEKNQMITTLSGEITGLKEDEEKTRRTKKEVDLGEWLKKRLEDEEKKKQDETGRVKHEERERAEAEREKQEEDEKLRDSLKLFYNMTPEVMQLDDEIDECFNSLHSTSTKGVDFVKIGDTSNIVLTIPTNSSSFVVHFDLVDDRMREVEKKYSQAQSLLKSTNNNCVWVFICFKPQQNVEAINLRTRLKNFPSGFTVNNDTFHQFYLTFEYVVDSRMKDKYGNFKHKLNDKQQLIRTIQEIVECKMMMNKSFPSNNRCVISEKTMKIDQVGFSLLQTTVQSQNTVNSHSRVMLNSQNNVGLQLMDNPAYCTTGVRLLPEPVMEFEEKMATKVKRLAGKHGLMKVADEESTQSINQLSSHRVTPSIIKINENMLQVHIKQQGNDDVTHTVAVPEEFHSLVNIIKSQFNLSDTINGEDMEIYYIDDSDDRIDIIDDEDYQYYKQLSSEKKREQTLQFVVREQ